MYFIVIKPLAIRYNTESNKFPPSPSLWGRARLAECFGVIPPGCFLLLLFTSSHPDPMALHEPPPQSPSPSSRGALQGGRWKNGPPDPVHLAFLTVPLVSLEITEKSRPARQCALNIHLSPPRSRSVGSIYQLVQLALYCQACLSCPAFVCL